MIFLKNPFCKVGNIYCRNSYKDFCGICYCNHDTSICLTGIEVCPIPSNREEFKPRKETTKEKQREKKLQEWLSLKDYERWRKFSRMKKTKWACMSCGCIDSKGPYRASPFHGCSVCCGNCENELTYRTGGGQSDPFRWIPKDYLK